MGEKCKKMQFAEERRKFHHANNLDHAVIAFQVNSIRVKCNIDIFAFSLSRFSLLLHASMSMLSLALEPELPVGTRIRTYHVSTPPTRCAALYNPPSNTPPQKTYCESQSLLVTIGERETDQEVAIFAIEAQIYTTKDLTTVFISKADSTGYAPRQQDTRFKESLLQSVTRTFVSWIIRYRHRKDRKLVLSLFARAQDQYLFPGSVDNDTKHVLTDRQLVRWWCRTLDKITRDYPDQDTLEEGPVLDPDRTIAARAHLLVPGHDHFETKRFLPPDTQINVKAGYWYTTSPLWRISPYPTGPPRCQVPHFPDDPKARFLAELDDEIADVPSSSSQLKPHDSPKKRGGGQWKSARTLEQFWELMAFRSECSSGRLVGFMWVIFTPKELLGVVKQDDNITSPTSSPLKRKAPATRIQDSPTPSKRQKIIPKKPTKLTGPIIPRVPRLKPGAAGYLSEPKLWESKYFTVPSHARGVLLIEQKAYDRVHDLLLKLDFSDINASRASTRKWIEETAIIAGRRRDYSWGIEIQGRMPVPVKDDIPKPQSLDGAVDKLAAPNILTAKKKPKPVSQPAGSMTGAATNSTTGDGTAAVPLTCCQDPRSHKRSHEQLDKGSAASNGVNLLGAGLVRKKAKT